MANGYTNLIDWRHDTGAAPGRYNGADFPTRVGSASYFFTWPDVPDRENRDCNCRTEFTSGSAPVWWDTYDLDPQVKRGRGSVSVQFQFPYLGIYFDDSAFPGAEWYHVSLDTRYPLQVQPWPNQSPYVVSLSKQKYVSLALLSVGIGGLDDPASFSDFSLGDDRGLETGIALGPGGVPLMRVADLNGDSIDDAIVRFPVSGLIHQGDARLGSTVLKVTALTTGVGGYLRGDLPITFVP